jgi:hypothetical protein
MKMIDDVIIIGMDSGYGNIKTANCCFPASVSAYDKEPVFKENLLVYTRLEKLLVDVVADPLLLDSVSESEYPTIYEDAFSMYVVDESCLFRYAARRAVDKKIKKLIREKTNITLRTKR